ncbi:uncharacterized protein ACA1_073400 [Acanthamoeba castellanii str. Neff]|uniref:Uncharacterized protein n=1 Tax=Acanthamoeba castellanii (strain ATCC 30010 / Neff) TaxID=1257118 RepID=L8HGZ2_ACACF|nr:uncharacterized protein ACA1_073400 [Acanthamoeba castellanii str. Neff]ELR23696.1 hypothetical protein ACA1_073400 [Acanthamoeba castellanii str. Neff]
MNGLAAVYGNHLGAQLLGLAQAAGDRNRPPSPSSAGKRWQTPDHSRDRLHHQQTLEEEDGEEYEDEIIEEMSGNWPPSSSSTATSAATQAVPRVDSVEWNKMEEGPDDETLLLDNAEPDEDGSPHRSSAKSLKRKRKPAETSGGLDEHQGPGKKRLSCIDCGCRAALKACTKVMCIDCCAKEGRVCDAHAKKLYEKEVRKLEPLPAFGTGAEGSGSAKDRDSSAAAKSAKKRARVVRPGGGGEGGSDDEGEEDSEGSAPTADRDSERDAAAAAGEEEAAGGGAKPKRSVLYETIAKQDKKIRALQNDLKELRTLLLSVVDKQNTFARQLRHISGTHSDSLVIDEDEDDEEDDRS